MIAISAKKTATQSALEISFRGNMSHLFGEGFRH